MLPRTGSTMLCSILEQTGVMGLPAEYLSTRGPMQLYSKQLRARTFEEYMRAVLRAKATDNGIFSLKSTYRDAMPIFERGLTTFFFPAPRFVYLSRQNVLAQAISSHKARSSRLWHRNADGVPLGRGLERQAEYSQDSILRFLDQHLAEQASWEKFFLLRNVQPLRITYEQLCDDLQGSLRHIFEFMDVPIPDNLSSLLAKTKRLADDVNAAWESEIRKEFVL
jgi:trehalose 2-sulfotransferase